MSLWAFGTLYEALPWYKRWVLPDELVWSSLRTLCLKKQWMMSLYLMSLTQEVTWVARFLRWLFQEEFQALQKTRSYRMALLSSQYLPENLFYYRVLMTNAISNRPVSPEVLAQIVAEWAEIFSMISTTTECIEWMLLIAELRVMKLVVHDFEALKKNPGCYVLSSVPGTRVAIIRWLYQQGYLYAMRDLQEPAWLSQLWSQLLKPIETSSIDYYSSLWAALQALSALDFLAEDSAYVCDVITSIAPMRLLEAMQTLEATVRFDAQTLWYPCLLASGQHASEFVRFLQQLSAAGLLEDPSVQLLVWRSLQATPIQQVSLMQCQKILAHWFDRLLLRQTEDLLPLPQPSVWVKHLRADPRQWIEKNVTDGLERWSMFAKGLEQSGGMFYTQPHHSASSASKEP